MIKGEESKVDSHRPSLAPARPLAHQVLATVVACANSCSAAPRARRLVASFCCSGMDRGPPHLLPWALARLLPSAVRVRIRSRSTSASPPTTASIKRPVLVPGSVHGSAKDLKVRLGVHDVLDDPEKVKGAAREAVNPRDRHHVAGFEPFEHPQSFARVGPCARNLLPIDVPAAASGLAQLLKLAVRAARKC